MTTAAGDPIFVDTNVVVYASVPESPFHTDALAAIRAQVQAGSPLWISRQIMREFLATLSRPQTFGGPVPGPTLAAAVRRLQRRFYVAEEGPATTGHLLDLITQYAIGGKQIHDANIVATMQAHGVPRLLTHNTADFARFAGLITVLPLVATR